MSKTPVYGFCGAGCKREVLPKDRVDVVTKAEYEEMSEKGLLKEDCLYLIEDDMTAAEIAAALSVYVEIMNGTKPVPKAESANSATNATSAGTAALLSTKDGYDFISPTDGKFNIPWGADRAGLYHFQLKYNGAYYDLGLMWFGTGGLNITIYGSRADHHDSSGNYYFALKYSNKVLEVYRQNGSDSWASLAGTQLAYRKIAD